MTTTNCATGTLTPFVPDVDRPWDRRRVQHLFRRMGFGADLSQVESALAKSPSELVDTLIDEALVLPLSEEPEWAYWTVMDYTNFDEQANQQVNQWTTNWMTGMLNNGFRDKLSLLWHNHFVTQLDAYFCPSYLYQYHRILEQYALGDFKQFVLEIGKTPAMLFFLNGAQNSKAEPNENYARELYELFTLGLDNGYTQSDIEETARALTGWNPQPDLHGECGPVPFVPSRFDDGLKTIFGQTGHWGYTEVHNLLFSQRPAEVAEHICRKIYRAFVNPCIDETIVAEMADTFQNEDFQLAPVFRQLFKSAHFFDEANIGVLIKSPVEYFFGFVKDAGLVYSAFYLAELPYFFSQLGQELWDPVDVAGWPGDRTWISGNSLTGRWSALEWWIDGYLQGLPESLRDLAKLHADNSNDPYFITRQLVDFFLPQDLQSELDYDIATVVFKADVPQNYYDDGTWNLDWETVPEQVALLLEHIARLPEFQLN